MVREARERSESGIYHIVLRGINRQDIFYDDDDRLRFLETLDRKKKGQLFEIYGYCLMTNHVHLLFRENRDTISRTMSRVGTSYAKWYNLKYMRSGHLFQGRYGSECIEDDQYLLTVTRYIHNNPVKAGMVARPELYRWSSIHSYYGNTEYPIGLTQSDFVLEMINHQRQEAIRSFQEFMNQDNEDKCLDDEISIRKTDAEVKAEIEALMNGEPIGRLQSLEKNRRTEIIRTIKASDGITQRQIARVTGLSCNIVFKT
ncbi:MAG: transposase [Ignavibacteriales bacterium]